MTARYPIVLETEESGAVSAYVPGLPVYAAADTAAEAERALKELLALYFADLKVRQLELPASRALVKVARVTTTRRGSSVAIVSPAALVGRARSPRKAAAARVNGARGGRPRRSAA
jgi:predicted RNase H-like HicB family nuclease